jgi:hypothetical protein
MRYEVAKLIETEERADIYRQSEMTYRHIHRQACSTSASNLVTCDQAIIREL